jgi:serine/threonine protein kinase
MWDKGLAHRDIKPANLLVRNGRLLLIDVAFAEVRPTPWRQAVDLANMMLCLALRSSAEHVYQHALQFFTVAEISEAFAAARGFALRSRPHRNLRMKVSGLEGDDMRVEDCKTKCHVRRRCDDPVNPCSLPWSVCMSTLGAWPPRLLG